jgi:hypothetical protein
MKCQTSNVKRKTLDARRETSNVEACRAPMGLVVL